jgi:hypothetical protein
MPRRLKELEEIQGFRALIVNLADGLTESLDCNLVAEYLDAISQKFDAGDRSSARFHDSLRRAMEKIVFDNVDRFQRQIALASGSGLLLATFRGLNNLTYLIYAHEGLREKLADAGAPATCFNDGAPSIEASADECRALAASINDVCSETDDFFLAMDASSSRQKRLVWFTDLMNLTAFLGPLPETGNDTYASDLRNWLGLGHVNVGEHLFGFVSTTEDVCAGMLARPTVFDGIDNFWFKHMRANLYKDQAGRAIHLDRLGAPSGPFDGGWEAVTPGPRFRGQFRCTYVGRVGRPDASKDQDTILEALLKSAAVGRTYDEVVAALKAKVP